MALDVIVLIKRSEGPRGTGRHNMLLTIINKKGRSRNEGRHGKKVNKTGLKEGMKEKREEDTKTGRRGGREECILHKER